MQALQVLIKPRAGLLRFSALEMSSLEITWTHLPRKDERWKEKEGGSEEGREAEETRKITKKERKKGPNQFPSFLVGLANVRCL